jgi:hypothetical protein
LRSIPGPNRHNIHNASLEHATAISNAAGRQRITNVHERMHLLIGHRTSTDCNLILHHLTFSIDEAAPARMDAT